MMAQYDLDGRLVESVTPPLEALEEQYRASVLPSFEEGIQQRWLRVLGEPQPVTENSGFVIHTDMKSGSPDFNTAAFVHDATLVFLSLQTRPYGNDAARQETIESFRDVVTTVLPPEKRAEARFIIGQQQKQILRLDMPGDQKAAVLQKLRGIERVFPEPPPAQALSQFGLIARHHASEALSTRNVISAVALAAFSSGVVAQNAAAEEIIVIDNTKASAKTTTKPIETSRADKSEVTDGLAAKAAQAADVASYVRSALDLPAGESVAPSNAPSASSNAETNNAPTTPIVVPSAPADKTEGSANQGNDGVNTPEAQQPPPSTDSEQPSDVKSPSADIAPASEAPITPEASTQIPAAFLAPDDAEARKGDLLANILNFFATKGAELTYKSDQNSENQSAATIMAAATVALNDPAVLAERDASLLPAEANAGVYGSLPGAGAVIEQPDSNTQTPVDEAAQVEAAQIYATAIEKIASEIGADPDTPIAKEGNEKPGADNGNGDENASPAPAEENLSKKEAQVKALHELAKADPTNWKNRAYVMQYLLEHTELNITQISGLIGNFCKEVGNCKLDPSTHQRRGPAIGIAQWDDRKDDLMAFAQEKDMPWDSIELQAMFIVHELKGKESLAYSKLLKAHTLEEASDIALNFYERPAARILGPRLAYAKKTLSRFMRKYTTTRGITSDESSKRISELPYKNMIDGASKHYKLKSEHGGKTGLLKPSELEKIGDAWGDNKLIPEAAEAFRLMNTAFKKEFGRDISIGNSYRTLERQREMAGPMAAKIGESRHGSGIAIDLGEANDDWGEKTREWINTEGWKYGWVNPLWAQKGASSKYEPWHIEFLGNQAMKIQIIVVKYQLKGHKDGLKVPQELIDELGLAA